METTLPQQSWQIFIAIFAFSVVFSVLMHFFIVSVSAWKHHLKF